MARTRQYDDLAARQGLVGAFLNKGYTATSLSELEAASGLDRRQLYNGYGDKKALLKQALEDFAEEAQQVYLGPLFADQAGLKEIRDLLMFFVDASVEPRGRLGCLVCNTARETVATDPEIKPHMDRFFGLIEEGYAHALSCAAARGEIDMDDEMIRRKSRLLFSTHVSLCVLARAVTDQATLRDMAEETYAALT